MSAYTRPSLERLWEEAGGSQQLAPTMAAIALAESGGNPTAHNASGASGLWQIMLPVNAGAVPGGGRNVYSPRANAAAAVSILKSQGLGAWSTYTNGAYRRYLGASTSPAGFWQDLNPLNPETFLKPKGPILGTAKETGKVAGHGIEAVLKGELGSLVLPAILLLAGAYLVVYGIMVSVRPRERALAPVKLPSLSSAPAVGVF